MSTSSEPHVLIWSRLVHPQGGAQKSLERVCNTLQGGGFRVSVALSRGSPLTELQTRLQAIGVELHDIPSCNADRRTPIESLDDLIDELRPDILDLETKMGMSEFVHSKAARNPRLKCVYTMRAPLLTEIDEDAGRFRRHIPGTWHWGNRRTMRRFLNVFDRIISVSTRHAHRMMRIFAIPADRFEVVPNGVDTNYFHGRAAERAHVVIGSAGTLCNVKRFDLLIRSFAIVCNNQTAELRIAGGGPLEAQLRKLVSELGLNDRVSFLSYVSDMRHFFASIDVFAMTSQSEGFPNAQLEAMASSLPSVVTDVGDMPVMVRDGIDGFVVKHGTAEVIAERLKRLLTDAKLRKEMGISARQRVCDHYSQQQCESATLDVFSEVAASF